MSETPKVLNARTEEAPYLATQSLLPIVEAFTRTAGMSVETGNISLAARSLAQFPDFLQDEQKAVSYTHRDVYKRQAQCRLPVRRRHAAGR